MRIDIQSAGRQEASLDESVEDGSWLETMTTALAIVIAVGFVSFVSVVMSMS